MSPDDELRQYGVEWYDRQGRPITLEQAEALLADPEARKVASDILVIGDEPIHVSTVHLVLDHSMPAHPLLDNRAPRLPLIFETMVFAGPRSGACWRWATEEQALEGHAAVIAELLAPVD